ncbi:alpha-tubulin N-acetyltransferase 1 isoform X2 [Oncorhynchus mykiss]|uniref:Alpha-tubulin N-acetyltransferase 1 n=1 Tax=Oncorhynchus mykiss TaxID=8022 RepID=A0A8K9X8J8_ONCMY|nr:alpha-tubulin N-acetyltransferase 1 isoform X2 [Oncorhynchus mykiss]
METTVDVNHIFPERITVLDQNLISFTKSLGRSDPQSLIAAVIDELGRASAKAQYLTAPITSASKLQTNKHHLYLLKDRESNGGRGLAVGFLKVGCKKLFLLDQRGAHVETEPLCVLDFFVTEHLQRHGYGLELFSFMLQHKKVEPVMMAYDRPSPKFLSFLEKHYCLKNGVPQVNNFVVFDGFFTNRSAVREEQRALPWPLCCPAAPPFSPPLSVSSPCSPSRARQCPNPALAPASAPGGYRGPAPKPPLIGSLNYRVKHTSQQGLVARGNLYSRYINTRGFGLLLETQQNTFKLPGLTPLLRERETDTGGQTDTLGHTDRSLPPLSLSRKELLCSQTTREPDRQAGMETRVLENRLQEGLGGELWPGRAGEKGGGPQVVEKGPLEAEKDRGRGGWLWTVGESCCNTAQWVRQKQEYNNTRPW